MGRGKSPLVQADHRLYLFRVIKLARCPCAERGGVFIPIKVLKRGEPSIRPRLVNKYCFLPSAQMVRKLAVATADVAASGPELADEKAFKTWPPTLGQQLFASLPLAAGARVVEALPVLAVAVRGRAVAFHLAAGGAARSARVS